MKTIVFMITDSCNLACRYCYADAQAQPRSAEISGDRDTVPEVLRAVLSYQPEQIVFSGGEPLTRCNLFPLLASAARASRVKLLTNGTLITSEIASRIRDCGVAIVGISLDSATPEPHNSLRSGSYDQVVRGIDCCLAAGLPVDLMVTVSRVNLGYVGDLLIAARAMSIERVTISDLVPQGRGARHASDLILNATETEGLLEKLARCRNQMGGTTLDVYTPQWVRWDKSGSGCQVGKSLLALRPDGIILPCTQVPVPLGNILTDDLWGVWSGGPMARLRNERRGPCAECDWRLACGGCRGKAMASGDLFGSDFSCLLAARQSVGTDAPGRALRTTLDQMEAS